MKDKKIIFFCNQQITIKIRELFFLDLFEKNGFQLHYWEYIPSNNKNINIPDRLSKQKVTTISSIDQIRAKLLEHNPSETIIISTFSDEFGYRRIFKILSEHHFTITTIYPFGGIDSFQYSKKDRLTRIFSSNFLKKIKGTILSKYYPLYKKANKIELYKYWFSSTYPRSFAINHPDYECFQRLQLSKEKIYDKPFIVFLDTFMPLHHDLEKYNATKYVSPANYQAALKDFFKHVEKKFNAEVIIAAHPKSVYEKNEFGNRKIIKYKTGELIKDSVLVISHMSNSTAFALLFNKPIVFITTTEVDKIPKFAFKLHTFVQHLNKPIYNIDNVCIDEMDFSKVSESYRNKYIYTYLTTPETEHISNEDILIKKYHEIFQSMK